MITQLLLAFQFLSIIPIRISRTVREKDLAGSMRYYPLVGAVLGASSALVFRWALKLFSPLVAAVSAVIVLVILSGALHLDGFADMCDGFYGDRPCDKILSIMKDSRSGAMAIVGVFCLLALKISLLTSLDAARILPVLVLAPALARASMVWLCASSTYARSEGGTASAYIGHVSRPTWLIATLFCTAIAWGLFHAEGLAVLVAAAVFTWIFRCYTERRIGGMTGDTLGACSECVEVLVLTAFSIHRVGLGL